MEFLHSLTNSEMWDCSRVFGTGYFLTLLFQHFYCSDSNSCQLSSCTEIIESLGKLPKKHFAQRFGMIPQAWSLWKVLELSLWILDLRSGFSPLFRWFSVRKKAVLVTFLNKFARLTQGFCLVWVSFAIKRVKMLFYGSRQSFVKLSG